MNLANLSEYKARNDARRYEDKPELREAVDDIYRLIGFIESAVTIAKEGEKTKEIQAMTTTS